MDTASFFKKDLWEDLSDLLLGLVYASCFFLVFFPGAAIVQRFYQAPGPMWLWQLCWLSAPGRDKLPTTKAGKKYNCFFEISMGVFSTSVFCFFVTTDI